MYLNEQLFSDFISSKEILWLGIDFSKAKFTKSGFNFKTQEEMRTYLNEWNMLIISDQKKYDIRMSFRKPIMNYDLARTTKTNRSIRVNSLMCETIPLSNVYTDEQMCEYASTIEAPTQQRFALTLIVESFDSLSKTGAVWVVIFETETREAVLCEKFLKVPSGFGTKNYWARVFYNILFDIKSYAYYRWENLIKNE